MWHIRDQLPSENATDLTPDDYADWAAHYERFIANKPAYALNAACARALAGESTIAIEHLHTALATGERIGAEWLLNHWAFAGLKDRRRFEM